MGVLNDDQMGAINKIKPRRSTDEIKFDAGLAQERPLHILLAEDNAINQKVAVRILERLGYRPDVAASGYEVLAALRRQPYDVILMDIQMPEMDGIEATQKINQRWPVEDRPYIIALTANALIGDREKYLEAGMDDYISKPIRINSLTEALSKVPTPQTIPAAAPAEPSAPLPDVVIMKGEKKFDEKWPIDKAAVARALGPDAEEMLVELLPLFFEDAAPIMSNIQHALKTGDADSLNRAAHTLKGSSASLGLVSLTNIFTRLENLGKTEEMGPASEIFKQLKSEFSRVKLALKQ
ncbi:MAG: response regulator, partial [Anaerolineae bacterium]